jgi:hypothetical protein
MKKDQMHDYKIFGNFRPIGYLTRPGSSDACDIREHSPWATALKGIQTSRSIQASSLIDGTNGTANGSYDQHEAIKKGNGDRSTKRMIKRKKENGRALDRSI